MNKLWDSPPPERPPAMPAALPARAVIAHGGQVLALEPATLLAPMSGLTDTVFRRFLRALGGCGLIMTEFTSADGLIRSEKVARRYLSFTPAERPIAAQLFGGDADVLAEAAHLVEQLGFDALDLNLGCPANKVVKCNGGSGLLRDLPVLARLFARLRAAVAIPFTVKYRAGWDERSLIHVELARIAADCGVNALSLHARTRAQGYAGQANWQWIAEVKQAVPIPVFGNGDVRSPEDAAALVAATGCDGVMIGRAAAANPWIFRQIEQYRCGGRYQVPDETDRAELIGRYFTLLAEERPAGALGKMKQFVAWFTHGVEGGGTLRKLVYESRSEPEALAQVAAFFARRLAPA